MPYYVYVMSNKQNGTLYIGITSDLARRVFEHREGLIDGFTKLHGLKKLVYYETYEDSLIAIQREKSFKKWNRNWKLRVIIDFNPEWNDLYEQLI
ncbi:MAG: GIY-YIG nuclease family protein [Alphaproteobacteria bacterium]|nr:GIY-YIG nuclease family protein [Alphaproteobacteria bacterium]